MEETVYYRKTRKVYAWFYIAVVIMLSMYIHIKIGGDEVKKPVLIGAGVFIIVGAKYTEMRRFHNLYGFNSQYIFHKQGIFKKRVKKVILGKVSDIILNRNLINRIFDYGDVEIHHFGGSGVIKVLKINNPQKFIDELQEVINKHWTFSN